MKRPKSEDLLVDFTRYCANHPNERFWQALRNWSGFAYIFGAYDPMIDCDDLRDTFYFEGKDK